MTELTPVAYDSKIEGNIIITRLDSAINWMRKNSLWPMPMGLACCAIELMAAASSRFDIARFGAEVMRFSPRQSDVMVVAGTVTYKMALAVKRIWDQMPEPKWCIAMGADLRLERRHVPLLLGVAGDRSTHPGGRLYFRLPSASRSAPRGLDETAAEDRRRALVFTFEQKREGLIASLSQ